MYVVTVFAHSPGGLGIQNVLVLNTRWEHLHPSQLTGRQVLSGLAFDL